MRGQKQKYPVGLSEAEIERLTNVVKRGKHTRREIQGHRCCCGARREKPMWKLPA